MKAAGISLILVALLVVALCVCFTPAFAQSSSTGALTGVVRDPSGAVIVGATITVTNIGTSQARIATTNATGTYLFSLLPPADYHVKFEAPGFETSALPAVTVNVTETLVLNHSGVSLIGAEEKQRVFFDRAEASFTTWVASADFRLAGTWTISNPGAGRGGTLTITQDGANLKGTLKGANRTDRPLDSITITGNAIDFTVTRQGRDGEVKVEYKGTVDGDNMTGTFKIGDGFGGNWTAKRG